MEPLTLFAATIGLIGVIHLLSRTVERFGNGIYSRPAQQTRRSDWYCFFQTSDLVGHQTQQSPTTAPRHSVTTDRLEERRRQQANRPRLQA